MNRAFSVGLCVSTTFSPEYHIADATRKVLKIVLPYSSNISPKSDPNPNPKLILPAVLMTFLPGSLNINQKIFMGLDITRFESCLWVGVSRGLNHFYGFGYHEV